MEDQAPGLTYRTRIDHLYGQEQEVTRAADFKLQSVEISEVCGEISGYMRLSFGWFKYVGS